MSIYFYFILFENVFTPKFLLVGFLLDYFKVTKKKRFVFFFRGEGEGNYNLMVVQGMKTKYNIKGVMTRVNQANSQHKSC
jgi:hypothetical protein